MPWINFKRIARAGFINFWRTPIVALASVITITVTIFVIGALFLSGTFLQSSLESIKNKVDISVAFKPDVTESRVLEVKKAVEALPEVKAVTYSSREQELADFKTRNAGNDLITQSLAEVGNPFGARLNILAIDPTRYESIAKFLSTDTALSPNGQSIVDQVSYKKDIVDRLLQVISASQKLSLAIAIVLILIALLVTFTTISLAIYISREEISLMKLVGAADNYVRGPFVIQGVISGVIGGLLAIILLYPATIWVRDKTMGVFGGINLVNYFIEQFPVIFIGLIGAGIILGVTSSLLAIRRHLKV